MGLGMSPHGDSDRAAAEQQRHCRALGLLEEGQNQ